MNKNPAANLDNKYSKSAQKIKSILEESHSIVQSKTSQKSHNESQGLISKYLNLAKRLHFLVKSKERYLMSHSLVKMVQTTKNRQLRQKLSVQIFRYTFLQVNQKKQQKAFSKLISNKISQKTKQSRQKTSLSILSHFFHHKTIHNLSHSLLRISKHIQQLSHSQPSNNNNNNNTNITPAIIMKTPKQPTTQQSEQPITPALVSPLNQLITYNRTNFVSISINILKPPLEIEIRKIANKVNPKGQQLLLIVLHNHVKALSETTSGNSTNGALAPSSRRSFNQKNSTAVYEDLGAQFFESDQQLHKLVVLNNDLSKAQGALELSIKYYTNRNYRFRSNKIVESRVRLLQLILSLLRFSQREIPSSTDVPPLPELKTKLTSFKELEVSHVRLIVQQLDQKVYELSTISEQIPQLETFKRTLDLTMPQHNAYLTKIVDVLIELHHKINKLISRRPEKLLKEIEAVQGECLIIEIATNQFITNVTSIGETELRLKPIYFDQKSNKSPDYFRKIQKNVVKLSEIIIECIDIEAQTRQRIIQIKSLIQVFWNLIAGMEQYEREWKIYRNRDNKSNDQQQIIQLLELCLKFVNDRVQKMNEDFEIERQAIIDGNAKNIQYLEEDISRLSRENQEQRAIIDELERENQQLRGDYGSLEQKYKELSRKYENQNQDHLSKLSMLEKRQKNYKDKIESLQSENEQKKVMITNITNDLKRVMKQSESAWKTDQKNKDMQQLHQKLNIKIQDLQLQLRNLKHDNAQLVREKQQTQHNNDLLMKKLDKANARIAELEGEITGIKHRYENQKNGLRDQIEELERKNRKLGQDYNQNFQQKTKDLERKQTEQRTTIIKKDQKIAQLSDKIIDLNNKLSQILNNYKNMQFELKRKQTSLSDMTTRIQNMSQTSTTEYQDLIRNYEISQRDLNNALAEIDRCRNRTVPDLETEIRRREQIIAEMQRIIQELEEKQSAILGQEQNNIALRRLVDQLEAKLKVKDEAFNNKIKGLEGTVRERDGRIRELENALSSANGKISQLDNQLRVGNEDKNRSSKDLDRIRDLEAQNSRIKSTYQRQLSQKNGQISSLQNSLRQKDRKIGEQASTLDNSLRQKDRKLNQQISSLENSLRDKDRKMNEQVSTLENSIREKDRKIKDLQYKLSNLENSLKDLQREAQRTKSLTQQLRLKEKEISVLKQQKIALQSLSVSQEKLNEYTKQIEYLKQKIRSLEDLIDIFTEQHSILQAKLRGFRTKQGHNKQNNQNYQKILHQYNTLAATHDKLKQQNHKIQQSMKAKEQELSFIRNKLEEANSIYDSPIHKRALFEESASKEKLEQSQIEIRDLRSRLLLTENKYSDESRGWAGKQRDYLEQIRILKIEITNLESMIHQHQKSHTKPVDAQGSDKYYLRIEGQKLEDLLKRMENGSTFMNNKLDQILSNSRRAQITTDTVDKQGILQQNRILIQEIRKIIKEKEELATVVREYPNPEFLTEYAFRIITYFSQIHPQSPEAKAVWQELNRIRAQNQGEQYFIILQEFTKFTLQECALEVYRRELRHKAEQLQRLKLKLNAVIEQTLASQKVVYEKTALTESRVIMFREKFTSLQASRRSK